MANGVIIPCVDTPIDVPFTAGSVSTSCYGTMFRVGKIVYYTLFSRGPFGLDDPIITITNASDRPKTQHNCGGSYSGSGINKGGGLYVFKTNGSLYQGMENNTSEKYVGISGCYEAAY